MNVANIIDTYRNVTEVLDAVYRLVTKDISYPTEDYDAPWKEYNALSRAAETVRNVYALLPDDLRDDELNVSDLYLSGHEKNGWQDLEQHVTRFYNHGNKLWCEMENARKKYGFNN